MCLITFKHIDKGSIHNLPYLTRCPLLAIYYPQFFTKALENIENTPNNVVLIYTIQLICNNNLYSI